jgi:hypothetical protein
MGKLLRIIQSSILNPASSSQIEEGKLEGMEEYGGDVDQQPSASKKPNCLNVK